MKTSRFLWPKKGNKPFAAGSDGEFFHLGSIIWRTPGYSHYFKEAAGLIIESGEENPRRPYRDELFIPVAYLYRHSLELKLKELVRLAVVVGIFKRAEVDEAINDHNLAKLWTKAKHSIKRTWPNGDEMRMKAVETIVNEFHKADKTGQAFRYPTDTNGRLHSHSDLPEHVSLRNLKEVMQATFNFLDGCSDGMYETHDATRSVI